MVYPRIDTIFGVYTTCFIKLIQRYPNPHKLYKKTKKELTEFILKNDYCGLAKS